MQNTIQYQTQQTPQQSLYIKKFVCIPTGSYKTPYQRSYSLSPNPDSLVRLESVLNSNPNGKVMDTDIAIALSDMVGINNASAMAADIDNGWSTKRLVFFMEVVNPKGGYEEVIYLQGYSEYYDPALTIKIDPNMKFYINSVLIVSKMLDPATGMLNIMPRETYNILRGENNNVMDVVDGNLDEKVAIRPTDLLMSLSVNDAWGNAETNVNNHLGSLDMAKALTSTRSNNNPVNYYSKIINSTISASNLSNSATDELADVLTQAARLVSEPNMLTNEFILTLHRLTGQLVPTDFTLNILEMIHPINVDFFDTNTSEAVNINPVFGSDNSEDLFQPTIENNIAVMGVQAIAGYMSDEFIVEMVINIEHIMGNYVVTPLLTRSFIEGIDLTRFINKILTKVEYVLIPELTRGGAITISGMFHIDLLADSNVTVSVNNQPMVHYKFPMFADSLFTPVKTTKPFRDAMADEVSIIIDHAI